MRHFHSYGPVDYRYHYCVQRKEMIARCTEQLVGSPEEGGHFFTIWAPRQAGKTWLMRQVKQEIAAGFPDRFIIGTMSVQGVVLKDEEPDEKFLDKVPMLMRETFKTGNMPAPADWESFRSLFSRDNNLFGKPVILFIDEFDSLPPKVIDRLVTMFRDMYLKREDYLLHGLALIGVRAVLGVESLRGSPFNIQRSLHVPNLTQEEVGDMFRQYQEESGQKIEPEVVKSLYDSTRGQPGLVGWFGELLTEKFNPGKDSAIDSRTWEYVYMCSCSTEWNNTVLNLIKKAKGEYRDHILRLFGKADMPFTLDADWCSYIYFNGIIDYETYTEPDGSRKQICRFASPFVQLRIYNALTYDLVGHGTPILALDPLDDLADVFDPPELNVPALIQRYRDYLKRLKAKGLNPWKDQPRRTDLHLTEYVGHFHLYSWLQYATDGQCAVSPEFPTGNGRVDLHLKCGQKRGIIEVKSFRSHAKAGNARVQAARYAALLNLNAVTLVLFTPVEDEIVLKKLSDEQEIDGVKVTTEAIGWV